MNGCDSRYLRRRWNQIVRKCRSQRLRIGIVGHELEKCVPDAMRNAALNLTVDDQRIDQPAAVMCDAVVQDAYSPASDVHFDFRNMRPVAVRRLRRREI